MKKLNIKKQFVVLPCFLFLLLLTSSQAFLQQESTITIEKVSGDVFCLYGEAANIGILKSDEALLVVDSEYARTADRILEEIKKFSPLKIKYLINTHYHTDHTGGNSIIGQNAEIISHKNCRSSLLASLKPEETTGKKGVPRITYKKELDIDFGKEKLKLFHFQPAHTSGDTVVLFTESKVVLAGDLFFHGMPPYIDVEDGSDTKNWILIIRKLAEKFPDHKVIPGHGRVTDMKSWLQFAEYLENLRLEVAKAIEAGKTREHAMESINLSQYSFIQDRGGFLTKKNNIGWIYDEMTRK
jgi:cyclase